MKDSDENLVQVLVCQRGARRRYCVPRLFEEAGMLAALYTDSTAYSWAGKTASILHRSGVNIARLNALRSRIPDIPQDKLFSFDRPLYASLSANLVSCKLSKTYRRHGLQGANVVYSMYGEDYDFLKWVKLQGAKILVDVFVHPSTKRIISEEEFRFLGSADFSIMSAQDDHSKRVFKLADVLLCPSNWVAEGVRSLCPEYVDKIRIVPYGSSLHICKEINEFPEVGRILFAGREPLRKGLHYLAEAANIVRKSGLEIDVRVAGVEEKSIIWMEHRRELRCLGSVPMDQMRKEYERADIFVLPSLSEGQAGVILEAMVCGCPVVATRESGVDFESGCGITIPSQNAEALAQAIRNIIVDRDYRNQLAQGAIRQAEHFSMEKWKQRLGRVVQEAATM